MTRISASDIWQTSGSHIKLYALMFPILHAAFDNKMKSATLGLYRILHYENLHDTRVCSLYR